MPVVGYAVRLEPGGEDYKNLTYGLMLMIHDVTIDEDSYSYTRDDLRQFHYKLNQATEGYVKFSKEDMDLVSKIRARAMLESSRD